MQLLAAGGLDAAFRAVLAAGGLDAAGCFRFTTTLVRFTATTRGYASFGKKNNSYQKHDNGARRHSFLHGSSLDLVVGID
ncbi:MAG: hypothetical protein IKO65_04225 [Victivallales bacterium]|nr:hypothetical protein [Victivallales bacterium]